MRLAACIGLLAGWVASAAGALADGRVVYCPKTEHVQLGKQLGQCPQGAWRLVDDAGALSLLPRCSLIYASEQAYLEAVDSLTAEARNATIAKRVGLVGAAPAEWAANSVANGLVDLSVKYAPAGDRARLEAVLIGWAELRGEGPSATHTLASTIDLTAKNLTMWRGDWAALPPTSTTGERCREAEQRYGGLLARFSVAPAPASERASDYWIARTPAVNLMEITSEYGFRGGAVRTLKQTEVDALRRAGKQIHLLYPAAGGFARDQGALTDAQLQRELARRVRHGPTAVEFAQVVLQRSLDIAGLARQIQMHPNAGEAGWDKPPLDELAWLGAVAACVTPARPPARTLAEVRRDLQLALRVAEVAADRDRLRTLRAVERSLPAQ